MKWIRGVLIPLSDLLARTLQKGNWPNRSRESTDRAMAASSACAALWSSRGPVPPCRSGARVSDRDRGTARAIPGDFGGFITGRERAC